MLLFGKKKKQIVSVILGLIIILVSIIVILIIKSRIAINDIGEADICIETVTLLASYYGKEDGEKILAENEVWGESVKLPIEWSLKEVEDRGIAYKISALEFLDSIYIYYCNNQNNDYCRYIHDVIMSFVNDAPSYDSKESEWPWHDDATAFRAMRLSYYTYIFKEIFTREELASVQEEIDNHLNLLLSDDFYTYWNNHGMHQDEAVIVCAILSEQSVDKKNSAILKALDRTERYLANAFTEEGIHKEHSPEYAISAIDELLRMREMVGRNPGAKQFLVETEKYVDGLSGFYVDIIKPDGYWPSLADSPEIAASDVEFLNSFNPYLNNNTTVKCDSVYKKSGYAVFRSSWADSKEKATWLLFVAATYSHTHKHGDDLSFFLYHKGDLITEAGNRDYNYNDIQTSWSFSGYGHNVIEIDGETYAPYISDSDNAVKTEIIDYAITENSSFVTGKEVRFIGIEHFRTIEYDRDESKVRVVDTLESDSDHVVKFLYHVAEGVEVERIGNEICFYRNGENIAVMSIEIDGDYLINIFGEEGKYPYVPWIFNGKQTPKFGKLIVIETTVKTGDNKYIISFDLK